MEAIAQDRPFAGAATTTRRGASWAISTGRAISGVGVAFLIFDGMGKLFAVQPVVEGTQQLGYPPDIVFGLGVTLLSCVLVYLVPATSVFGAVLLTGYLGGAVATHVRVGSPLVTHVLFPTYVAALLWGGLMMRDARLRALFPWRDRSRV